MPAIHCRVVDPKRRTVEHAREGPDILYSAPFQGPCEMDFATAGMFCTVRCKRARLHLPAADQPAVEIQLFSPIGGWTVGAEGRDKYRAAGHVESRAKQ